MTGVTTHGEANFTFYAVGTVGVHYIDIYQGYPGPGYLNAEQIPYPSNLESYYPPLIPFHAQFTITSEQAAPQGNALAGIILPLLSLGLVISTLVFTPVMAFQKKNGRGFSTSAIGRIGMAVVIAALLIAGTGVYLAYNNSSTGTTITSTQTVTSTSISDSLITTTQTLTTTSPVTQTTTATSLVTSKQSTSPTGVYVPQVSVVRPEITVPKTTATSGPRISVTPNVATVGTIVNVTGAGFAANSNVPLSWSTEHGSNIQGYQNAYQPLRNVTTAADGSFRSA